MRDQAKIQAIYDVIRGIPRGKVATYAQVAALAGMPRGGRHAAKALALSQPRDKLPWHRVVGKLGVGRAKIAIVEPAGRAKQRKLLRSEGVVVSDAGTISLHAHGWLPLDFDH